MFFLGKALSFVKEPRLNACAWQIVLMCPANQENERNVQKGHDKSWSTFENRKASLISDWI